MTKFALVGCGRISKRHSDLLGNNEIKGASLAAVCDSELSRAQAIGKKYHIPAYSDMDEMMKSEDIDAVTVLTPSGYHAQHTINLAKYGKHIVVEKPMALTLDSADAMIKACEDNGARLFVVKQNRFNVPVAKLREALDAGRFGKLTLGTVRVRWCRPQSYYDNDSWRGTWAYDGGVLTNQASHHVDLLEWMMGEVESVFAKGTTALADIETEDTAVVTLKFKNGALGVIEATTAVRPKDLEGSLSVMGDQGTVIIGGFAVNELLTWDFADNKDKAEDILKQYSVNPPNVYGYGHKAYYDHVIECLHEEKPQLVDGAEGRKSLELITAIYESIETGKEVLLATSSGKCRLGGK